MSLDVELALKEEEMLGELVTVEEEGEFVVVRAKGWLGGDWHKVNKFLKDKFQAEWVSAGKQSHWRIPIENIKQATPTLKKPETETHENQAFPIPLEKQEPTGFEPGTEDESAFLKPTYEKLGPLLPVFRAPSGEIIDGKHRLQLDPGWFSMVLRDVNDPVKLAMARLVVNVVRRRVPASEKSQLLSEIAKLTGWSPREIADSLGMSYTWVMKYLPDEFKKRPGAGPKEYPVTRRVTQQPSVSDDQIASTIQLAPEEVRPKLKEVVVKQKFTPEETAELIEVIKETPKEKRSEVLLQPRTSVLKWKAEHKKNVSSKVEHAKPKEVDTGFEWECPECHRKYQLIHVGYLDGSVKHKFEVKS